MGSKIEKLQALKALPLLIQTGGGSTAGFSGIGASSAPGLAPSASTRLVPHGKSVPNLQRIHSNPAPNRLTREGTISPLTPRGERGEGGGTPRVSKEGIVEIIERLKSIYEVYLAYEGAKPSPVLFKCGEEKIASRVVPYSMYQMYGLSENSNFS